MHIYLTTAHDISTISCQEERIGSNIGISEQALDTTFVATTIAALTCYQLAFLLVKTNECFSTLAIMGIGGDAAQLAKAKVKAVPAGKPRGKMAEVLDDAEEAWRVRLIDLVELCLCLRVQ